MNFELVKMESVTIAGITLRTNNSADGMQKILQHWGQFFEHDIAAKVEHALDFAIYEAYFDYDSDANGAYTLMLGKRVSEGVDAPVGLRQVTLPAATYAKFTISDPSATRQTWEHIWGRKDLNRTYSGDFEVIGEKSADIYVAVEQ